MKTLMLLLSTAKLSPFAPPMAALVVAGKLKQAVAEGREAFERQRRQPRATLNKRSSPAAACC